MPALGGPALIAVFAAAAIATWIAGLSGAYLSAVNRQYHRLSAPHGRKVREPKKVRLHLFGMDRSPRQTWSSWPLPTCLLSVTRRCGTSPHWRSRSLRAPRRAACGSDAAHGPRNPAKRGRGPRRGSAGTRICLGAPAKASRSRPIRRLARNRTLINACREALRRRGRSREVEWDGSSVAHADHAGASSRDGISPGGIRPPVGRRTTHLAAAPPPRASVGDGGAPARHRNRYGEVAPVARTSGPRTRLEAQA